MVLTGICRLTLQYSRALNCNHRVGSSFLLTLQEQRAVVFDDIFKEDKFLHKMLSITVLVTSEFKPKSVERWNQRNTPQVADSMQKGFTLLSEHFDSCRGKKKSKPQARYHTLD